MTLLNNKKIKRVAMLLFFVVFLTACTSTIDREGQIKEQYIITLSSSWNLFADGWFRFFFVIPIGKLMVFLIDNGVHGVTAMAVAVMVTRLITLPLTLKSTVMSERSKEAQPEMLAIQAKYKDRRDPQSQQQMMAERKKVNEKYGIKTAQMLLGSILTLPIFLATYQAVTSVPDVYFATIGTMDLKVKILDGIKILDWRFILLFVIVGISQFLQMKLGTYLTAKKSKPAALHHQPNAPDPTASTMNIMIIMVLGFSLITPAIMGFYWIIGAVFGIAQTLYIHKIYIPKATGKK